MSAPPGAQETRSRTRRALAARLRAAGIEDAALEARLLVEGAAGAGLDDGLAPDQRHELERSVARRLGGEPVFRILGEREFWGLPFALSPATLEPRSDTETLVAAALAEFRDRTDAPLRLLDLGTGSGCILVALLSELPNAIGLGVDRSEEACRTAARNADRNGVGKRARFVVGDWTDAIGGAFDLVVSNPPYIPTAEIDGLAREVRDHDPRAALDGGRDGLDPYRRLARDLAGRLVRSGRAVLEIGAGQGPDIVTIMAAGGLAHVGTRRDLGGHDRALVLAANAHDMDG